MIVKVRIQGARNLTLDLTTIERCGTVLIADQMSLPTGAAELFDNERR